MKIFILEDNKNVSEVLKRVLTDAGHQVTTAFTWKATKPLLAGGFDIYIVDFVLPDIQGSQAMEIIAQLEPRKDVPFILISGIFDERHILGHIPENLKKQTVFIKKPIDSDELLEKIGKIKSKDKELSDQTFHGRRFSSSSRERFFNKTVDSRFLVDILLLFNARKFSGDLIVKSSGEENSVIEFYNGGIVKVISINAPSYFGNLLVEHGFSLQEEIEKVLAVKEKKYIGQILIEKGLLSPHIVNLILREQAKIRLSTLISAYRSFTLKTLSNTHEMSSHTVTEFNRSEILDLAVECIKTKFSDVWLEEFYLANKNFLLQPIASIQEASQKNRDFLSQYNDILKSMTGKINLTELVAQTKLEKRRVLELVYLGIASSSLKLTERKEGRQDIRKANDLADMILTQKEHNLFEVLHLPWKASIAEVNKNYKDIIKVIHPDNLPHGSARELKEKCEKTFKKVNAAYGILADEQKRREYCEQKEMHKFSNTLASYEKAVRLLKAGNHKEALELFNSIKEAPFCPDNVALYILWAEMETYPDRLENKEEAGNIRQRISKSPIELRISPLFWFVSGLFYSKVHQYEKAGMLFKKALKINRDFTEASRELMKVNSQIKDFVAQNKKSFFKTFFPFKKSG